MKVSPQLLTNYPALPRRAVRPPRCIDEGNESYFWPSVEEYINYRLQFFGLLDILVNELDHCFDQRTLQILTSLEHTIISAANGK